MSSSTAFALVPILAYSILPYHPVTVVITFTGYLIYRDMMVIVIVIVIVMGICSVVAW